MDTLQLLLGGFATVFKWTNLLFAVIGCFIGTLVGVLPGLGPAAATAILIPVTFALDPTPAIIMLAAIFYGSMYGGTITSVLINTPGEPASAVTCIEGYAMAKQGRAGAALAVAAIGSFIGGTIATVGLVVLALPLTKLALRFGPPEYFALMVMGLTLVTWLAGKSFVRGLQSAFFGLLIATVGSDPVLGTARLTFDTVDLLAGFNIVTVAMGLFGIAEILSNAESSRQEVFKAKIKSLWMSRQDVRDSVWPIGRGTLIGFFLGLVPGLIATVPTIISYALEKRLSKHPERFGTGVIEGIAGPETANNAYANAALIPLFTLGIPSSPTIAILMGALLINGLIPGPMLFVQHADFAWAVIASLCVGNLILLILNLPLVPLWVAILRVPYSILAVLIMVFCIVGAYSLNNTVFDIGTMLCFGIIGYVFKKCDYPLIPMVLTLVLGPLMEKGLRQSLEMSGGDISIFFERPIAATILAIAAGLLLFATYSRSAQQLRGSGDSDV